MKNNRKLLVSSFIMIITCCLLFTATTFAWFSDSVSSNNNIITAGNLDIELDYSLDGTNWTPVAGDAILPADDLWEPGFTRVVYFRITNSGSLALKYTFNVNILQDNGAVNVDGDVFYLTSFLKYGSNVGTEQLEKLADRKAYAAASTKDLAAKNTLADDLELDSKEVDYGWFALTMPTTVGNEANTKPGTVAPSFEIGFDLLAYQTNEEATKGEAAVPVANVKKAPVPSTINIDTVFDQSDITTTLPSELADLLYVPTQDEKLETEYSFYTIDTLTEAQSSQYKYWHADFVISFDKDVKENTVAIAGQYDNPWTGDNWVVVTNNGFEVKANEPLRLLANTLGYINYEELSQLTEGFHCGAFDINDALVGTTMTVELRLYETTADPFTGQGDKNVEVGEDAYIVIGKYTHTFAPTAVSNAADLNDKLTNGGNVVLTEDVSGSLVHESIYKNTPVAVVQKGGVLDGNGHSLIVENPQFNGYALETWGGTIKNLSITSTVGRGIVISSPNEDILIENVTVDGPGYALNTTEYGHKKLSVMNSTINGWTSFAGLELATFVNCKFGENTSKYWQNMGYDQDYDRLMRPYNDAMFIDCEFEQGYYFSLDQLSTGKITFNNCTVNGVVLTAENYASYITIELPAGRTLADCVVFN